MPSRQQQYELLLQEELKNQGFVFNVPELRVVIKLLKNKIDMNKVADILKRFNLTHSVPGEDF